MKIKFEKIILLLTILVIPIASFAQNTVDTTFRKNKIELNVGSIFTYGSPKMGNSYQLAATYKRYTNQKNAFRLGVSYIFSYSKYYNNKQLQNKHYDVNYYRSFEFDLSLGHEHILCKKTNKLSII